MNKLYLKSPIFLQQIYTSAYGIYLKRQRYNKFYKSYLKRCIEGEINPKKELEILLKHLKENIPYYRDINLDYSHLLETFYSLPITEKDDLRKDVDNRSYKEEKYSVIKTGGTTGKSLIVYTSSEDMAKRMAYLDYVKMQHKVKPFSKRASFTGKDMLPHNHKNVLWRYNLPINQILYSSYKLNNNNIKYVLEHMRKHKPITIDGYPSVIHILAKYILRNNITIDWDIKAIFPTSENLTADAKNDIETAFKTIAVDQYASNEGAPFIYHDKNGKYVIGHETGIIEFFRVEDDIYDMVVTSLINYTTPLIRYKIGDQVKINSTKNYLSSLEDEVEIIDIIGRASEYLVGNEYNKVQSTNLSTVIKQAEDRIIQAQFIQHSLNELTINLVVDNHYVAERDEKLLIASLNNRLGKDIQYNFQYMKEIPKENSGKTRFIINKVEV